MAQFPSALQVPRLIRILERDCRGIKHADFNPDLPCLFFRRQNIEGIIVTQTLSATILISTQTSLFYLAKTRCVTSASLLLLRSWVTLSFLVHSDILLWSGADSSFDGIFLAWNFWGESLFWWSWCEKMQKVLQIRLPWIVIFIIMKRCKNIANLLQIQAARAPSLHCSEWVILDANSTTIQIAIYSDRHTFKLLHFKSPQYGNSWKGEDQQMLMWIREEKDICQITIFEHFRLNKSKSNGKLNTGCTGLPGSSLHVSILEPYKYFSKRQVLFLVTRRNTYTIQIWKLTW